VKVLRLDLLAYGPFSGARIELDARPGVVDLVYGPNEAGKSTTLRAVSGLLFGIPERTDDAHRHASSELRVGALLESQDGKRLEVVRRKGRKNTLRGPDDALIEESVLSKLLLGTTRELFEGLFGLDHERLRASGQALLSGKGNVGESLFAAGIGGRGIHELSTRLKHEAEELFVPRARERKITRAIADVKEARDAVRQGATPPSKFLEQERALEEAKKRRDALFAQKTELLAERARLGRIAAVLPSLRRRKDLTERLHALGDVVELPEDATAARLRAVRDIEEAGREDARAAEREARCELSLAGLVVPEGLADVDDAVVADLRDRRGSYNKAQADLPKRRAQLVASQAEIEKGLQAIGMPTTGSVPRLSVPATTRIRSLAGRRQALDQKLDGLFRMKDEVHARRAHLSNRLTFAASPEHREALRAALDGSAALPTPDAVERFAGERSALEAERARLSREQERCAGKLRDVERRLDALRRLGDIPSEGDLRSAREARDGLFVDLKDALVGARPASAAVESIRRVEEATSVADTIADRLRREADRVALRSTLEADGAAAEVERGAIVAQLEALSERERELDAAFRELWSALGIVPRTPAEMRSWARDAEALRALGPEVSRADAEVLRATEELSEWRREWSQSVEPLGLSGDATGDEASAVLDSIVHLVRKVDEADQFKQRVDGIVRDSTRFAQDVAERCRALLPEAAGLPPEGAAERFVRAVEQARAHRAERLRLEEELGTVRRSRAELAVRRKDAEARLATLVSAARVESAGDLEDAERRSADARELRRQIADVDRELAAVGDGMSLDVLDREASGHDLDRTRARLSEIDAELEAHDERMQQAFSDVAQLDRGVQTLAQSDAANAAALLEDKVSTLKRHAHRYVRVRLASVILAREIERYRQANQGPIVARANELFPRLTVGRYSGLRVGFGEDGESVLLAVRSDGSSVGIEALSDGTRDQLYLALRLSSLERYAQANEPMPLVLDDVLIHFDDARAAAALSVLGDVARSTQVLFFTHHARLAELARTALGPERLAEHAMPVAG